MNIKIMTLLAVVLAGGLTVNLQAEGNMGRDFLVGKMDTRKSPIKTGKTAEGVVIDKNKIQLIAPALCWKGHWNAGQFLLPASGKIVLKAEVKNAETKFSLQAYGGKILPPPDTFKDKDGKITAIWNIKSENGARLSGLWLDLRRKGNGICEVRIEELAVWRTIFKNRIDADKILQTPPVHTAKLLPHNGAMTLFVDNKPLTGQMWSHICYHNVSDKYLEQVVNGLDYPLVAIPFAVGENRLTRLYPSSWTGLDEYDWSYIDRQARRVLKVRSDVKIILMLAFDGAKWWTDNNPESANPEVDRLKKPRFPGTKGIPDYLAPKWKKTAREVLRQLIAHVQSSDWGKSVIGYELFNGSSMDCNFEMPHENERVANDFRRLLKDRYKTDSNLEKAWHNTSVSLKTAQPAIKVPSGLILEPAKHQRFLDTRRLIADQFREVFSNFAAIVKTATHGRALVGARTGDFFGNYGWNDIWFKLGEDSGWLAPLLKDPNFDYFDVQEPYPGRALGDGAGVPVLPVHALYKYKKAVFIQNDVRTHLSRPGIGYGRTPDLESTIQLQRRVFVNSLTYGMIPYLWQMDYLYNQPELMAEYRLQEKIMREALAKDRSSVAEVAIVFDPEMRLYLGNDKEYTAPSRYFALFDFMKHVWQRGGAPFDMIFIDQIKDSPPYRVYVFCNTWRFSKEQYQMISEKVFRNGQTAVFLWADGLIAEDRRFDTQALSRLTGMDIQVSKESQTWQMAATREFSALTGIKPDSEVGILPKQNYDACAPETGKWKYTPTFHLKADKQLIPLAKRRNNQIAAAMRKYKDYTVIYSASGNLTEPLLRLALQSAKGFEYTKSNALLMLNKSYIAFHTYKSETIKLKLPKPEALRNLFDGTFYPVSKVHSLKVTKNKTYLFERIAD